MIPPAHNTSNREQAALRAARGDPVNPAHYKANGIEAIDVIEAFGLGFNLGNAIKYILRAGRKSDTATDLAKASWYLQREIGDDPTAVAPRVVAPDPSTPIPHLVLPEDYQREIEALKSQCADITVGQIEIWTKAEREVCARVAEEAWDHCWHDEFRSDDADEIRKLIGSVITKAIRAHK